ncbi:MAG: molybdopterin-dependent oxidoreductase, partial [Anaerolineales bacterium]|nr:molybdopterin-dependent oxidoreductase [Anaerolineales bacterium]
MTRQKIGLALLISILVTAPILALNFLGYQLFGWPFIPYELFNWVARELPGPVVTFGIDLMIDTLRLLNLNVVDVAKTAERGMAVMQLGGAIIVAGAVLSLLLARWGRKQPALVGLLIGLLVGLPVLGAIISVSNRDPYPVANIAIILGLTLAWGLLISWSYQRAMRPEEQLAMPAPETTAPEVTAPAASATTLNRRQFLVTLGAASAVITVAGSGVAASLASAERRRQEAQLAAALAAGGGSATTTGGGVPFPNAKDPLIPAPGTRLEYTPLADHYQVFLSTEPSIIEEEDWQLTITGLIDNPMQLTLQELKDNYEKVGQFVTLTCISGRVGTGLISTTHWGGLRVSDLLADLGVQPEAKYMHIRSADGFYETVDLELVASEPRLLLAYEWDGIPIPKDHGFPLRIWIPDRYGMKQPKWITDIEITDEYIPGYWVERNWDEVAQVRTTSVIDTVAASTPLEERGQTLLPVGGIAYAGARGISKVEVRVD